MKKEEILANCIEEIRSGKSTVEDCVNRYPALGKELRSLLEIAAALKTVEVIPSPEFKERVKGHLFEEIRNSPVKISRPLWTWHEMKPAKALALVLIGVLILVLAGGGTVYAAQSSVPGDALYPVKTGVENIQLAVTPGAVAKAQLHLKLAQRRINEVTQQVKMNHGVNAQALEAITRQYDAALKELSKSSNTAAVNNTLSRLSIKSLDQELELEQVLPKASQVSQPILQQIIDVTRRGNTIAQIAYANHDFLEQQPSITDETLDAGQFTIEGTLLSIQDKNWNIGGTVIENVNSSGKAPAIGSQVKLQGLVKDNNAFISNIEVSKNTSELTKVEGQFVGNNQNGTADISGIPVKIGNADNTQLKPGDNVQLQGGANDNKLNVTSKESNKKNISNLSGVLVAVDTVRGTITVKTAGNKVVVNINEAQIENESGRNLTLSDLNHLLGQDVKLDGLNKKGAIFFAGNMRVEAR
jgi:hypothetical protein